MKVTRLNRRFTILSVLLGITLLSVVLFNDYLEKLPLKPNSFSTKTKDDIQLKHLPSDSKRYVISVWISKLEFRIFRKSLQLDLFYDRGNFSSCEYKNCILKEDKASINDSDAVLIPFPELQLPPTTNRRRSEQVWVFWAKDGPFYPRRNRLWGIKYLNSINWTITYRRDSDIIYKGYGQVKRKSHLEQFQKNIVPFDARKDRSVAWFVSHCQTKSHREEYVLKLRQYISVDIVGPCNFSNSQCLPKMSTDCYNWLEEHYKFYLAFENKICKDYISEKFFAPLSRYVVPVVLGGGDYSSMAPSGSYIDVRDFKSPKDLADFLDVLDRNDSLYSQYFKWKEEYDVIPPTAMEHSYLCELCKRMNNQDIFRKVYPNIRAWWERGGCNAPWW